jgi:four helix bundle protein
MDVRKEVMRSRTRQFALRIIRLYASLPKSAAAQVIAKQILRSGTSVGAHYAESCRAKSRADFVNKVEGAMQELEETSYWLELLADSNFLKPARLALLHKEASELMSIFVSMVKNTKSHMEPR